MDQRLAIDPETQNVMLLIEKANLREMGMALAITLERHINDVRTTLSISTYSSLADVRMRWSGTPMMRHHETRIQAALTQGKLLQAIVNFWLEYPTDQLNLTARDLALLKNPLERLAGFYTWVGEESFSAGILLSQLWKLHSDQTVPA